MGLLSGEDGRRIQKGRGQKVGDNKKNRASLAKKEKRL